jgi:hypothetical protein
VLLRKKPLSWISRERDLKWLHNFGQRGKWNFCLTTGTLVPANQERPEQKTTAEPLISLQGEGGVGGDQG